MSPRPGGILYQNLSNFCNISLPNVNYLLAKMISKKLYPFLESCNHPDHLNLVLKNHLRVFEMYLSFFVSNSL